MPLEACIQAIIILVLFFYKKRSQEPNKTMETSKDKADPPNHISR
jgi:hypothetical protein